MEHTFFLLRRKTEDVASTKHRACFLEELFLPLDVIRAQAFARQSSAILFFGKGDVLHRRAFREISALCAA